MIDFQFLGVTPSTYEKKKPRTPIYENVVSINHHTSAIPAVC